MRLGRASAYGLLAMLSIARANGDGPVQVQAISEDTGVPVEYLRKLLGRLRRSRLINSVRGRNGGYILGKEVEEISILKIIEAIEGPIDSSAILEDDILAFHRGAAGRSLRRWRSQTAQQLRDLMDETTLDDIHATS